MAEGGGGARRRAPALLEAARARYESLHISDDVFGESGPESGGNPFYSTSAASRSSSAASSDDEHERPPGPPPCVPAAPSAPEPEEDEAGSGWSAALRDRPPPRFEDTGGPTRKMPPGASAIDFFQLFVPDNLLKSMAAQTNMYARKFQERFGGDGAWADVTLAEMKAFLGYMISTSISHCESVLSIWSGGFYSNRGLAGVMSQARFERVLKYFHVVAFRSGPAAHGLYKVQPFLDALQSGFDAAFRPSQTQVLHEPLIDEDPVFIATCTERELRKRKKRKFSLWVRQCSSTGFIVQIYVHLKEGAGPDGLDALKNRPQLHGAVARSLCRNAGGKNYIVFTGPSITSLALFEEFEKQGGDLLLRAAQLPEERLHGPAAVHAGQPRHAARPGPAPHPHQGQHVAHLLVQQGPLPLPHQRLLARAARRDHQAEERGGALPPGRGGVRRAPQLHLQIRRQVQQVLHRSQAQQDVAAGVLVRRQHRRQQRLHPLQALGRLPHAQAQPRAVRRETRAGAAGPGGRLPDALRAGLGPDRVGGAPAVDLPARPGPGDAVQGGAPAPTPHASCHQAPPAVLSGCATPVPRLSTTAGRAGAPRCQGQGELEAPAPHRRVAWLAAAVWTWPQPAGGPCG